MVTRPASALHISPQFDLVSYLVMGQYQTRPSKSETDLEAREGELDIRISDRTTGDADVDEQPIKDDPVFGSPIDSKMYQ